MTNDTTTNNNSRLLNTTTCFPISYGSIAFYLGKDTNPTATHRWTLYLRSPDQSYDLSSAISKVIFQLHPSFPQPTRELTSPPFEVTEMGWGEFEASIRIVWRDEAEERPVLLNHFLRLYPSNAPVNYSVDPSTYMNTTVPVVSERYDEVVFTEPKVGFHKLLLEGSGTNKGTNSTNANKKKKRRQLAYPLSHESSVIEHFRTYGDEGDVKAMLAAKEFLQKELRSVKDRLIKADEELEEVKGLLSAASSVTASAATASITSSTLGTTEVGAAKGGVTSTSSSSAAGAASSTGGGKGGTTSSKSSKKKKAAAGSASGEPAAKKAKS